MAIITAMQRPAACVPDHPGDPNVVSGSGCASCRVLIGSPAELAPEAQVVLGTGGSGQPNGEQQRTGVGVAGQFD